MSEQEQQFRQLQRISAWARLANENRHLQHYIGDLVHDGWILTAHEGACVGCIRDAGTHLFFGTDRMSLARSIASPTCFGPDEEGKRHWYYGYPGYDSQNKYIYVFDRMPADEAIAKCLKWWAEEVAA